MLDDSAIAALIAVAAQAREHAHAPYSRFTVGAAVVADDDGVFFGANVENASYGLSLCAERAAIASAVSGGARRIKAIVLVTETDPPSPPCGACRQWLAEFGNDDLQIILARPNGCHRKTRLGDLLPLPFRLET